MSHNDTDWTPPERVIEKALQAQWPSLPDVHFVASAAYIALLEVGLCDGGQRTATRYGTTSTPRDVLWVVIRSDYGCGSPAVDVLGPFDTADAAFNWLGQQVGEDEIGYQVKPVVTASQPSAT